MTALPLNREASFTVRKEKSGCLRYRERRNSGSSEGPDVCVLLA